jgi:hypothetical protein
MSLHCKHWYWCQEVFRENLHPVVEILKSLLPIIIELRPAALQICSSYHSIIHTTATLSSINVIRYALRATAAYRILQIPLQVRYFKGRWTFSITSIPSIGNSRQECIVINDLLTKLCSIVCPFSLLLMVEYFPSDFRHLLLSSSNLYCCEWREFKWLHLIINRSC